jgi:hypothetical protein
VAFSSSSASPITACNSFRSLSVFISMVVVSGGGWMHPS